MERVPGRGNGESDLHLQQCEKAGLTPDQGEELADQQILLPGEQDDSEPEG
jgi:hypothetical protein